MGNITLNTETYNGTGVTNGVAQYIERSAGVAAGFSPVTGSVRQDSKSRVQWKLAQPVVATEASSCSCPGTVIRVMDADIRARLDPGATLAERTDFALRLKDLVASVEFQQSIINLQQPGG